MQTQLNFLSYRIDLDIYDHYLAIEIDENEHGDKNIGYIIKRQTAIEPELVCKFVRIDPDEEDFDKF